MVGGAVRHAVFLRPAEAGIPVLPFDRKLFGLGHDRPWFWFRMGHVPFLMGRYIQHVVIVMDILLQRGNGKLCMTVLSVIPEKQQAQGEAK